MDYYAGDSANEIVKGIWVGNMDAAQDWAFFKRNKIGAVLNITPDIPNKFYKKKLPRSGRGGSNNVVEYMQANIDDSLKTKDVNKMTRYLPHFVSFIYKCHKLDKRNVFIHCHAGMERSTTAVVAYLMTYYGKTRKQAIKHIIAKRPIAFFGGDSINFDTSLKTYATTLSSPKSPKSPRSPKSHKSPRSPRLPRSPKSLSGGRKKRRQRKKKKKSRVSM